MMSKPRVSRNNTSPMGAVENQNGMWNSIGTVTSSKEGVFYSRAVPTAFHAMSLSKESFLEVIEIGKCGRQ